MDDPLLEKYSESELKIVAEFLCNWTPFLTRDLCPTCTRSLSTRIRSLDPEIPANDADPESSGGCVAQEREAATETHKKEAGLPRGRVSWADMVQEDELELEEGVEESRGGGGMEDEGLRVEAESKGKGKKVHLSRDRREIKRCMAVARKKDFICLERVNGRIQNVLDGLELHTGVFNSAEQSKIVGFVYGLQEKGRKGELGDQTYSEPTEGMQGKGQVTIQFGCYYDYAVEKEGCPPGILRNTVADPLPPLLKTIIRRMVRWHVLPPSCVPDSCTIKICESGDRIPPHIYSHDIVRPFCMVFFLSECNMVFGANIKTTGASNFTSSATIALPVGSVLVFNGNGADLAKHAVPAVPTKWMSITFWKTNESKQPFGLKREQDLHVIQPLPLNSKTVFKSALDVDSPSCSVDTTALRRVEYVGRSPGFGSEQDSHGKLEVYPIEIGNSSNRTARSTRQFSKESTNSEEAEVSIIRSAVRNSSVNSRGISSLRDDGTPFLAGTPKSRAAPPMRIVCMDDRRIVVRTDAGEDSLDNTSELVDSKSSANLSHRRRKARRSYRR